MLKSLLLIAAASTATAAVGGAPDRSRTETCGFTTEPVEKDMGQGFASWGWTEPYRASLFADGLLLDDAAFKEYTKWLGKTIPRDVGGLDPFNQTACLLHQRGIFKGATASIIELAPQPLPLPLALANLTLAIILTLFLGRFRSANTRHRAAPCGLRYAARAFRAGWCARPTDMVYTRGPRRPPDQRKSLRPPSNPPATPQQPPNGPTPATL